jgi:hypothetical protein
LPKNALMPLAAALRGAGAGTALTASAEEKPPPPPPLPPPAPRTPTASSAASPVSAEAEDAAAERPPAGAAKNARLVSLVQMQAVIAEAGKRLKARVNKTPAKDVGEEGF